nr:PREDICTED: interleukin-5 receptor subunit alpha-like [Paralichthys olivaceus]
MLLLVLWSSFLVMWQSEGVMEGNNQDVCQGEKFFEELHVRNSSLHEIRLEKTDVKETFTCLLYPSNRLNCSWSFLTEEDMQLSVCISVCDDDTMVQSLSQSTEEHVGSKSLVLQQHKDLFVILQFNMSQHDKWTVYTYMYELDDLEVLSPPSNISAAVKDGSLLVTWRRPKNDPPPCFEYQLDLDNQEPPKHLRSQLSYTELSADPTFTYRVRMRTRKTDKCIGSAQWSEWSPTVTVESSSQPDKLNMLLIISISLGIPMILLALLLLVHHQRLSKLLFPPIPCPPPKYIYFLEENETFIFFHPMLQSKAEEVITKVEDKEENP